METLCVLLGIIIISFFSMLGIFGMLKIYKEIKEVIKELKGNNIIEKHL